jgi:pimeloyl-ACP methyl ester carboxylesterase
VISTALEVLEDLGDVDPVVREKLVLWLRHVDSVELDAITFSQLIGVETSEAERIADALAEGDVLERREGMVCVGEGCGVVLSGDSLEEQRCRNCGTDLNELAPRAQVRYSLDQPRARDVGWLIAVHGIQSRGVWQEQLQWLVDRQFLRTIPFRNWKYGRIFFRAFIPVLQRRVVQRFLCDVRRAEAELAHQLRPGTPPPPDVVAHSFGTWIVAHALLEDPTLRLGRVILVGSILRPDWDWSPILERRQIAGLLNYCGGRDPWVRIAERFIPDAGPSGLRGFAEEHERIISVRWPGGTHSSVFSESRLQTAFVDVWRPFLSDRTSGIDLRGGLQILPATPWVRAPALFRAPLFPATTVLASLGLALSLAHAFF